jgi:hypothetical protein
MMSLALTLLALIHQCRSAHAWGRSRLGGVSAREEMEAQPPHSHRQHDSGKGQREDEDHCTDKRGAWLPYAGRPEPLRSDAEQQPPSGKPDER